MAKRHESALRQHRRSLRARERNHQNLAKLKTGLRKIRSLLETKKADEARKMLGETLSLIDHSVTNRAIHRNAAARLKSRITRQSAAK